MSKINRQRRSELLLRSVPMLSTYVKTLVEDSDAERDVIQEVILRLLSSPGVPDDLTQFGRYGRKIAFEIARGDSPTNPEPELADEALDPWLDPERAVDTREALERAVHHLGDDALELLVRRYVLGENARELSSGRPQTPAALRVRLMRLRSSARAAR
jgi:DNA-directed RNA polymerase specialized sigma24 family protein